MKTRTLVYIALNAKGGRVGLSVSNPVETLRLAIAKFKGEKS